MHSLWREDSQRMNTCRYKIPVSPAYTKSFYDIDHYRRSLQPITCRRFADSNSHTTKILETINSPASQGYFKEMYYVLEDQQQTLQSAYIPSTSERQIFLRGTVHCYRRRLYGRPSRQRENRYTEGVHLPIYLRQYPSRAP
ncbi:hypothetical protein DPMN_000409 [Dreissena polymorpha]|uniref:Uncharacterized protein n=1 Tax=Dreissena polymorpha TaxID=45954 RepID=A0A9D4MHB0_DREPO|nr:hypothetical protein DPMN_000409 [Dreissena polymorpha]